MLLGASRIGSSLGEPIDWGATGDVVNHAFESLQNWQFPRCPMESDAFRRQEAPLNLSIRSRTPIEKRANLSIRSRTPIEKRANLSIRSRAPIEKRANLSIRSRNPIEKRAKIMREGDGFTVGAGFFASFSAFFREQPNTGTLFLL